MKVYVIERCGTSGGVPGAEPDERWRLVSIWRKKQHAEERITTTMRLSEFEHYRVREVEVR